MVPPSISLPGKTVPERHEPYGFRLAIASLLLVISAVLATLARTEQPWIDLPFAHQLSLSIGLGLATTALAIFLTRRVLPVSPGGHALLASLRPDVRADSTGIVLLYSAVAATGEELLFRGVLLPWIGFWLSTAIFASLHRMRGKGGFAWAASSALLGACLALNVLCTGTIVGAVIAHVLINTLNALYLRRSLAQTRASKQSAAGRNTLGGLLGAYGARDSRLTLSAGEKDSEPSGAT
jgi:uncharacterized protein